MSKRIYQRCWTLREESGKILDPVSHCCLLCITLYISSSSDRTMIHHLCSCAMRTKSNTCCFHAPGENGAVDAELERVTALGHGCWRLTGGSWVCWRPRWVSPGEQEVTGRWPQDLMSLKLQTGLALPLVCGFCAQKAKVLTLAVINYTLAIPSCLSLGLFLVNHQNRKCARWNYPGPQRPRLAVLWPPRVSRHTARHQTAGCRGYS